MKSLKLLIIHDNLTFSAQLERCFSSSEYFHVLPSVSSGAQALEAFSTLSPDIALLDMIMPGMDGMEVLTRLKERGLGQQCMIFALSSFYMDPVITQIVQDLGVVYFFAQPLSAELVFNRVLDFISARMRVFTSPPKRKQIADTSKRDEEITNYLHALGVPAHMDGYKYLKEAVQFSLDASPRTPNVTTELYPVLAKRHNKSWNSIERCIRSAIESAWQRGDIELQYKVFGYTVNSNKGKPTNKEFIAMLTEKMIIRLRHL